MNKFSLFFLFFLISFSVEGQFTFGECPANVTKNVGAGQNITTVSVDCDCVNTVCIVDSKPKLGLLFGTPTRITNTVVFNQHTVSGNVEMKLSNGHDNLVWVRYPFSLTCAGPCPDSGSGSGASQRGANSSGSIIEDYKMQFQDLSLKLSPNPTNGTINLIMDIPTSGIINIQIFDIYGRAVYSEQSFALKGNFYRKIQLSDNLAEGTYFIKVGNDEKFVSKKILLMK